MSFASVNSLLSRSRPLLLSQTGQAVGVTATTATIAVVGRNMCSSTEINTKSGFQQPNRLTTVYQRMKEECPSELQAYSVCVDHANNTDELGLQQGSCQSEFSKVQDCFQRARYFTSNAKNRSHDQINF